MRGACAWAHGPACVRAGTCPRTDAALGVLIFGDRENTSTVQRTRTASCFKARKALPQTDTQLAPASPSALCTNTPFEEASDPYVKYLSLPDLLLCFLFSFFHAARRLPAAIVLTYCSFLSGFPTRGDSPHNSRLASCVHCCALRV